MGTITAQTIVDEIEADINDTGNDVWTEAEHLTALNDAQRAIVTFKPEANAKTANHLCAASVAKQTIPTTAVRLIYPYSTTNMGTDGATPGAAITKIDMDALNRILPSWRSATGSAVTKHIIYDPERDPRTFYTYPPQAATPGYIELIYGELPADIAIGAAITLGDEHKEPIKLFMRYRAANKTYEGSPINKAEADRFFGQFFQWLGVQNQAEEAIRG